MCDCKNTDGFKEKLRFAKAETARTNEIHVVFHMKAVKQNFVSKETDLNDELGICCYFLPDGTEVEYVPGKIQEPVESKESDETISDKDYADFIDHGKVSKAILKAISEKVKAQAKLTERENAIFVAKTSEVEKIIAG